MEPSTHVEPRMDDEPSPPSVDGSDSERAVHSQPSPDVEPSSTTVAVDGMIELDVANTEGVEESHGNIDPEDEEEEDEDEDEEDDERPTLEEQRSLLSLAAEHDRVDVIQELLRDATLHDTLLAGVVHPDVVRGGEGDDDARSFVPPPLHAAVAHGSTNASSCLLRMGADPSVRPAVPSAYLTGGNNRMPRRRSSSGHSGMEEDGNYRKYHDMSAWELAFGSSEATVGDEDGDHVSFDRLCKESVCFL